jgi:hypothetical protein
MNNSERVPCSKCGALVLPLTVQLNKGLCAPCAKREIAVENARLAAVTALLPKVVKVDDDEFDSCERDFMREIVRYIKNDLEKLGLPSQKLREATGTIAFSFASLLDNCGGMQRGDESPLIPVLTFAEDMDHKSLVARSGGTYMHEYIGGVVDQIFKDDELEG